MIMHSDPEDSSLQRDGHRILAELASARGLTDQDVATVCAGITASERQARRAVLLWLCLLLLAIALVYTAKRIAGWDNKNINALLFILAFVPLAVVVFSRANMLRLAIERKLRCKSCHKRIGGFDLMKVRDSHCCPHCSTPDPLAARAG